MDSIPTSYKPCISGNNLIVENRWALSELRGALIDWWNELSSTLTKKHHLANVLTSTAHQLSSNLAFNQIQFSNGNHLFEKNYRLFPVPSIFCWFSNLKVRWKMNETRPGLLIKKWKKLNLSRFQRLSPSASFQSFVRLKKGIFCSRPLWLS